MSHVRPDEFEEFPQKVIDTRHIDRKLKYKATLDADTPGVNYSPDSPNKPWRVTIQILNKRRMRRVATIEEAVALRTRWEIEARVAKGEECTQRHRRMLEGIADGLLEAADELTPEWSL